MKSLLLLSMFVFMSCEVTMLTSSICGNDRTDLPGFDGVLSFSIGGFEQPTEVKRLAEGEYVMINDPADAEGSMRINVCEVNGSLVAEMLADDVETGVVGFIGMNLVVTPRAFMFESMILDTGLLDAAGIAYEAGSGEAEGFPLSFVGVDNTVIRTQTILAMQGNPEGKTPITFTFLK